MDLQLECLEETQHHVPNITKYRCIETDRSYLERLERRDADTEAHFVSHFSALINCKLRSRTRSRQVVDDIRQETFVRVFAAIRAGNVIRNPERLGAFVNSVCHNIFLEFCRSSSFRTHEPVDSLPLDNGQRSVEDRMLQAERTDAVREVLDGLSERDRNCLRALLLEERDKAEICREFNVDRPHLRVLFHRAKLKFKAGYMKRHTAQMNLRALN